MIRQPIITVLGHVDHGKTLLLDRIRGTTVAEKEAGAITQHIGATEIPAEIIQKISGELLKKYNFQLGIPGLLFIDTPGHEAFTSLRTRGGSIADLAILVIDINQGIQKQTKEAIEILKNFKTPFIIAVNKIDKIYGWKTSKGSFSENEEKQTEDAKQIMEEKIYRLVGEIYNLGFNSERFDRCKDFTKEISIVPVSAMSGEGFPELLMLITGLSQKFLKENLNIKEDEKGKGTILEVKEERGMGTTIDVILYSGKIKTNDKIGVITHSGVKETKIRALLKPKAMEEMRLTKERFQRVEEVQAASGIKISAPDLEGVIAGSPLIVIKTGKEIEELKKEMKDIKINTEQEGVIIKADTLGSLEAMIVLIKEKGIHIAKADIGEITKKDVLEAKIIKEKNYYNGIILGFNVKVDLVALEEAGKNDIKIFQDNVIYKILEDYDIWYSKEKEREKIRIIDEIGYPCKMRFLEGCCFRNCKPAIIGIRILEGKLKKGIKIMNKEKEEIGEVKEIQANGKDIEEAIEGQEVAISIDNGNIGKNLKENEVLYTYISLKDLVKLEQIKEHLDKEVYPVLEEIKKIIRS